MLNRPFPIVPAVAAIGLVVWAAPSPGRAQMNTPHTDEKCINDHAGVVKPGDERTIRSLCKKADKDKVYMMVVTVGSLGDFKPRPLNVDRFVDSIFDEWDIEYEESGDAALLFVSVKENEFRIVLGDRYADKLRTKASGIIRSTLVSNFRKRRRSQGIRQTASRIFHEVVKPHIQALKKAHRESQKGRGIVNFD